MDQAFLDVVTALSLLIGTKIGQCAAIWPAALCCGRTPIVQSGLTLAVFITLRHFCASDLMKAEKCAGRLVIDSNMLAAGNFSRNSASSNTRRTSALTWATMSRGVSRGANSPNQDTASKPGSPASAAVGMSGNRASRLLLPTASNFTLPACEG